MKKLLFLLVLSLFSFSSFTFANECCKKKCEQKGKHKHECNKCSKGNSKGKCEKCEKAEPHKHPEKGEENPK